MEIPGNEIGKLGERFVEGVPGLLLVAILLNIVLEAAVPNITRTWVPICSILLAWAGEKFGHYADEWLYDPFWEPGGWSKFPKKLTEIRDELAQSWKVPVTGLYTKAAHLSEGTEIWEKKVKPWLELSKASRSFMFLSVAALLWLAWPWTLILSFVLVVLLFVPMGKAPTGLKYWLSGAALIGVVLRLTAGSAPDRWLARYTAMFFVSTGIYLGLRIFHNIRLYQNVATIKTETRNGFFCVGQRVLPVRRVVLCSPGGGCDPARGHAQAFLQTLALLHVDLRATFEFIPNSKDKCNLNLDDVQRKHEKSKPVEWGANRQPIPVPAMDNKWAQVPPDLVIHFVCNDGLSLKDIIKPLNGAL